MKQLMSLHGQFSAFRRTVVTTSCLLITILVLIPKDLRAQAAIDYNVSIIGVSDSGLEKSVLDASRLLEKSRRAVLTRRALRRRVEDSLKRISALLRSRSYYAANAAFKISHLAAANTVVIIEIKLGPTYRIGTYNLKTDTSGQGNQPVVLSSAELGLKSGEVAKSDVIASADNRVLAALGRRGFPLSRIKNRRVLVDHKTHLVSVDLYVETGPHTRFGTTNIKGLENVERALVERHIAWSQGAPFDSEAFEATRKKLRQTGLFSSVLVQHADNIDENGDLRITILVTERKHRSIGAGAAFSTTEGPLGKLFWEHRNLWGQGERIRLRGEVGEIRQGAFGDLRVSDFGTRDQDLVFDARVAKEQPDGFTSVETAGTARLERRFRKIYAGSVGIGFDRSNVEENTEDETFTFLTFPLSLRRDTSDDLLDPGKGRRDSLTFTPNIGIVGTDTSFYSARLFDTAYIPLMQDRKLVLAGWVRIGSIFGDSTLDIPANKRLYSGGAGSVRGYALNSIGPLDVQNDPIGGRSTTAFGAELRWRAFGSFGFVAFAEAGGIYDTPLPDWGQDLQWGAGLGVRYLTKIGPLRLDVAVPLNRRNAVDDAFQILVSLGQAF
jgi:translocation and assembly module TamA